MPPDSALTIASEDGFDVLKEVTIDEINTIKLYDRYPETWTVFDLTETWKCGVLKETPGTDPAKTSTNQPAMSDSVAGKTAGGGLIEGMVDELSTEIKAEADTKTAGKQAPKDAFPEQEMAAKIEAIQAGGAEWRIGTGSDQNPLLKSGQHMFVSRFILTNDFDPQKQSCFLHFERPLWAAIYVNGRKAFNSESTFATRNKDISGFVRKGENTVGMLISMGSDLGTKVVVNPFRETEAIVAPAAYVDRMLISTETATKTLRLDLTLRNNGGAAKTKLVAKVNSAGTPAVVFEASQEVDLKPGENAVTWTMTMPNPVFWSPSNPHLYEIRIADGNGAVLGKDRFGFRDFTVKDGFFFLNGKRIKLFGSCCFGKMAKIADIRVEPGVPYANTLLKRNYTALLKAAKLAGLNTFLDYGSRDNLGRGAYEACDELGILFYATLPAWGGMTDVAAKDLPGHMAPMFNIDRDVLFTQYNHPCLVMLSFGAELYMARPENLKLAYDFLKPLDKQNRPVCSSSGRAKMMLNLKQKDTTDVADDHSYWGTLKGAWVWNRGYFKNLKRDTAACYAPEVKPLISFETLDSSWSYYCSGACMAMIRAFAGSRVDKARYIKAAGAVRDENDEMTSIRLVLSHGQGSRKHYTDEVYAHTSLALLWQRIVEIFRQEGDLEGWGLFHAAGSIVIYPFKNINTLAALKKTYPDAAIERMALDINQKAFIKLPQYYMLKRCYNPELISARWFDRNLIAGSGTLQATVYVNNDTTEPHAYTARLLIRDGQSNVVYGQTLEIGQVAPFDKGTNAVQWAVPVELPTGYYRLNLFLFEGARQASDNNYEIYVINPKDLQCQWNSTKKVAVYSVPGKTPESPDTPAMLDKMGLKYDLIQDFKGLDAYTVLIIGAHSVDPLVATNGPAIAAWIEKGRRLLCLEQVREGVVPWLPDMKTIPVQQTTAADIVDGRHPVFAGLEQRNFDTWSGNGCLYSKLLSPLNNAVVAAAAAGYVLQDDGYVKSAVCDVGQGKGMMLLNQLDVTTRYGKDAVATRLANNMVAYILSDSTEFSWQVGATSKMAKMVDKDACTFIDLETVFNSCLEDKVAGDRKGGWTDGGSRNDLSKLPRGDNVLGGVPFMVADAAAGFTGNNCVTLGMKKFPGAEMKVEGIKVGDYFNSLYILHAALAPADPAYTLVVHYEDGEKVEQPMMQGITIGTWNDPRDWPQANVAWSGTTAGNAPAAVYRTEWLNPNPSKKIVSLDLVSATESGAAVIAITGYKVIGEEGWETKQIQKKRETIKLE